MEEYQKIIDTELDFELEKKEVNQILNLLKSKRDYDTYIEICHKYVLKLFSYGDYKGFLKYTLNEVEVYEIASKTNDKKYANALYNVGWISFRLLEYEKMITYYNRVIVLNTDSTATIQSYAGLARYYGKKGDYYREIESYKQCINKIKKQNNHELLLSYYNYIAIAYDNINTKESLEKALFYLNESTNLIEKYPNLNTPKNNFTNDIAYGNIYNKKLLFNFKKAKQYYKKGLLNAYKLEDSIYISNAYHNLSELYLKQKKDSTLHFINRGLKYAKQDSLYILSFNLNKSLYLSQKENHQEALENIQKALSFGIDIDSKNWRKTPRKMNLELAQNKRYVLDALIKKAEILNNVYKQNPKDSIYLKTAINTIKSADQLIDIIQKNSIESKSKFLWRNEASRTYKIGLESALLLKDKASAFYFMERNKAILLTESVIQNTEDTKLPLALYNKGISLKKKIFRLEYKKQQKALEPENKVIADSLFNAKEAYQKYIDSVRTIHPNYLKKTLNIEQVTLENIQKGLASNTVLISYMWNTTEDGDDNLFSLIAGKQSNTLFKIEDATKLRTLLTRYKTLLSIPIKNKNDKTEFRTIAFNLYEALFPTDAIRDTIKNKTLVIVADGELLNIPFESLITKEDTDNYLLLSNNISYAYSFSFLEHNNNRIRTAENNFIGYATNTTFSDSLNVLKNAAKEIKTINSIIDGAVILNENATKAHFLNKSFNSKIIHLATHADASKNPWIAFSDEKLNLYELYTYKNNADLVTLSACNTSIGEIASGEGALSLARGFFYSGANSVVASLWNANDKSTAFLMEAFYKNLNKGQTKTEALNNAKRYYLKTHSLSEVSPYYWAPFTLIGDYETVIIPSYTTYYTIVTLSILLGLGLFFMKKLKKRKV